MDLKINAKLISLFLVRLFEIAILYVVSTWLWFNFPAPYNFWIIISLISLYVLYAAVTLFNDHYELTRGEGEAMQ
ncbi:hypothetical protein ACFL10_01380 [Patescibacteria group bacterium]